MSKYSLELTEDFGECEWQWEAKGWFPEARLTVSGQAYLLTFYDAVRLGQDIESELQNKDAFFEPNLVVIPSVTRANMEKAVEGMVRSGRTKCLALESDQGYS